MLDSRAQWQWSPTAWPREQASRVTMWNPSPAAEEGRGPPQWLEVWLSHSHGQAKAARPHRLLAVGEGLAPLQVLAIWLIGARPSSAGTRALSGSDFFFSNMEWQIGLEVGNTWEKAMLLHNAHIHEVEVQHAQERSDVQVECAQLIGKVSWK